MTRNLVPQESIASTAERLLAAPKVERSELALEFEQSAASSVALHVEGRNFYPPMLADIAAATSSVHINQFGFRPGVVGDRFAEVLIAKARDGVPVRRHRRPAGIRPRARLAGVLRSADGGRDSGVRRPCDPAEGATGAVERGRGQRLEPERPGAHRPPQGRGRRRHGRLGRRRRDRGSLRERRVPRPVRARRGPGRGAAPARVRRQPALARWRHTGDQRLGALPAARELDRARSPRSCSTTHRDGSGRSPPRSPSSSTERRSCSTSSIRMSPTAA